MNASIGLMIIVLITLGFGLVFGMNNTAVPLMGSAFLIFWVIDKFPYVKISYDFEKGQEE